MKIRDIVSDNRIITVSESNELYTRNINRILQREISTSRISKISNYILNTDERFFSSLVVAIHQGTPKRTDIDLYEQIEIEGSTISEDELISLGSKYGILSLSGNEQIFALDGQHRLKGIRKAFNQNPDIGDLEISLTFVIHNHDEVERTRRLFTVLNKYAEKPRGAELIILDEDDVAAINTRRLVTEHPILSKPNAISNSKTGAISNSDNQSFTTLVTLNSINKIIYNRTSTYYTQRPAEEDLNALYQKSVNYWDTFFNVYPEIVSYIDGNNEIEILEEKISRNHETGGSLLLRPVGQELIAKSYMKFNQDEIQDFSNKLRRVNFNLSNSNWKYLFWNEKMLGKEQKLKNCMLLYIYNGKI
jgi:DNA sulfur modification protein DndB